MKSSRFAFLLAALVALSAPAFAGEPEVVHISPRTREADAARIIQDKLELAEGSASFAFELREPTRSYLTGYVNGDFVILWGVGESEKDQRITQDEYVGLWRVMNYLAGHNFRVVMNTKSVGADFAEALESPTSSVVVWSAHGNEGAYYDFEGKPVPYDVFAKISPSVYQVIVSTCYSTQASANYPRPTGLKMVTWNRTTNASELLNFLVSDQWNVFDGKTR